MPEMKNIRVREAKIRDKGLFRKLWKAFLEEMYKKGGKATYLPTETNLDLFETIFEAYTNKQFPGIVLFVGEDAVLMWGDSGAIVFETEFGKQAVAWGTYVSPEFREMGISEQMTETAVQKMKALGFDWVTTAVLLDDEEGRKATDKFEKISYNVGYCLNRS